MVQLNLALREINCKIVYFGPGLSGKTTNLEQVFEKAPEENRGQLTSIATESDRTLFFDFMPLNLGQVSGMNTKFQLYTVPGQVYYNSTRKLVLRGADGVVFVADSSPDKVEENIESLDNLEECLAEQGRSLADMPHVIQFNKRDLPDALSIEDMERQLNRHGAPVFEGVASKGEGVVETFKALSGLVLEKVKAMSEERQGAGRPRAAGGRPAAPKPAAPAEPAADLTPAPAAPVPASEPVPAPAAVAPPPEPAPAPAAAPEAPAAASRPAGGAQRRRGAVVSSTRKPARTQVAAASGPKSKMGLLVAGVALVVVAGLAAIVL